MKAGTKPRRHEGTQPAAKPKPARVDVLRAMYGGWLTVFRDGDQFSSETVSLDGPRAIDTTAREVQELLRAGLIRRDDAYITRIQREAGLEAYALTAEGVREVRSAGC